MKPSLAASFLTITLAGLSACGGNHAVAGVYELDKAAFKAGMQAMVPANLKGTPQEAAMIEVVKDMVASIELKADGSLVSAMQMSLMGTKIDERHTGTWKLDGQKLTLVMKSTREGAKEETKVVDYTNHGFAVEHDQGGQKVKMAFQKK